MPEIMPPQLAGVQQRPFYVKARSIITAVSILWLILAVAGYGSFSGGTTSLALSLALMYGTGMAILVVASALYRLVKRSAVRRIETAPQDAAAAAFVDATRFAAEEIRSALSPSRSGSVPAASAWKAGAEQRAAAVPVFREPGAQDPSLRNSLAEQALIGPAAGFAAAGQGRVSEPKPSGQKSSAPKSSAPKPAAPEAARPAAGGAMDKQPAGRPAAGKSVVNKKASSKKKKSGRPRTGQLPAAQGKPGAAAPDMKRAA
ncbi:hypothetical protein ACWGQ2_00175 [Arthrobacter sp. NPDC055585]